MDLRDKIAAAKARTAAAKGRLTDADIDELSQREELARAEAEAAEIEQRVRGLDLDRRVDRAREALPDVRVEAVAIEGFPDTFVVRYSPGAYRKFQAAVRRASAAEAAGKRGTSSEIDDARKAFVLATVIDWNGVADYEGTNAERTRGLSRYLQDHPGLLMPVLNAGLTLAGVVAEERKSGG